MRNQGRRRRLPVLAVAAGRETGKEAGAEEWAHVGVGVEVEGLTKSFGSQNIWSDVTLSLPPGEISVMLGPSGTGKSVFLKTLVGLLKPDRGSIMIKDVNLAKCSEH